MFNLIKKYQMNIMLSLCAICIIVIIMLLITKFLSKKRKRILICQEILATLLLFFDRMAYFYAGHLTPTAYIMVRLSNFFVFFLTSAIVLSFNSYLIDLMTTEGKLKTVPRRFIIVSFAAAISMLVVIISAFTGFYYYIDTNNNYHRGPGFLLNYLVPVAGPLLQYSVIFQNRKRINRIIYIAITLYIFLPIAMGIIQIFTYGISIVNMMMVMVSVSLYIFSYIDINAEAEKAHISEINYLKEKQNQTNKIFGQTAMAFVDVIEKNEGCIKGHSERTAVTAKKIALRAGKSEEDCEKIYYSALLCDVGADSLEYINDYPFLSETARYVGAAYSESIPEYARIVSVARDFDRMTSDTSIPPFYVRDTFIREAGFKYDPVYAQIAVRMLDEKTLNENDTETEFQMESEITCYGYREHITAGIDVIQKVKEVSFMCDSFGVELNKSGFSLPSLVIFDSSDAKVQTTPDSIESHKYLEYAEIWFDSHVVSTGARNIQIRNVVENNTGKAASDKKAAQLYRFTCGRFEDHLLIQCTGPEKQFDVIVALPSASRATYIGLTGENVHIFDIKVELSDHRILENEIPRIAEKLLFTERITSDIPNVQIPRPLCDFTKGIIIKDKMNIFFHTQNLPDANLVWHCPYILLYYSDDKIPFGKNYREYAMIKLDGEDNAGNEFADNNIIVRKTEDFSTWEEWEAQNRTGYECQIEFFKKGNQITLKTQNKGIFIQNTTIIKDGTKDIFVALSGDQVALTDIRIR